jgi:hypothetical protein
MRDSIVLQIAHDLAEKETATGTVQLGSSFIGVQRMR